MTPLDERVRRALAPEYEVERRLGEGGMGVVYLARELALQRRVAVKLLRPELDTADSVTRFLREARALARVKHPNVVTVHHVLDQRDGLHFFVMEYIEGPLLHTRLKQGPLSREQVATLGRQLLAGLAAAHESKVIHLDIKPSNVFLAAHGAVLGDFGIARVVDGSETRTSSNRVAGTFLYMPPEMRQGLATERSDLYQVGAVLYESLTGKLWRQAPEGRQAWKAVPRRLITPIRRAVAEDERARWPDAKSFARALPSAEGAGPSRWWVPLSIIASAVIAAFALLPRPPIERPLEPRVDLTLLGFTGADSTVTGRLARYVGEPLERFARISVRPISLSLHFSRPRRQEDLDALNTRRWITGEVTKGRLELQVYNARGKVLRTIEVPNPAQPMVGAAGLLAWGRAAADSLIARQFPEHLAAYRDVGGLGGSDDPLAVDAFLKGEEAFHRDEYESAGARYQEALAQDPRFAVALWHLSLIHRWQRIPIEKELAVLDRQYRDRLPPQYQVLLAAQLVPELRQRFAAYEAAIERFPDNGYAVLLYADELFHRGPLEGISLDSALVVWRKAVAKVPYLEQGPAYDHMIWGTVRQGRQADAKVELARRDEIVARSHAANTSEGSQRARFFWLTYYERFHPSLARAILWQKFWYPDSMFLRRTERYVRLGLSWDIPEAERSLGQALVRHSLDGRMIARGHEAQGLALTTVGRATEGRAQFDSAAHAFRSREAALERWEWRLIPGALGLPQVNGAERAAARAALEQLSQDSVLGVRASWALAFDALRWGDDSEARRSIGRVTARSAADSGAARLGRMLKAIATARAGRLPEALTLSAPLLRYNPTVRAGDPFARSALYLLRAEWLDQVGRWQEAERTLIWYQNSDIDGWAEGEAQAGDVDGVMSGLARLRRGTLLVDHGRPAEGCPDLLRLQQLWQRADTSYGSLTQELGIRVGECSVGT